MSEGALHRGAGRHPQCLWLLYEDRRQAAWRFYADVGISRSSSWQGDPAMSANRPRRPGTPNDRLGLSYYPAPLPAGPWAIPLFWLTVMLLAVLLWWLS